jgi:H+/Cl- antiporter ClcA
LNSGAEEVIQAYNDPNSKIDEGSFLQKMVAAVITIGLGPRFVGSDGVS